MMSSVFCAGRCNKYQQTTRKISKYIDKDISAKSIRQNFLDFFINKHEHYFVRSSPVVPFCDPSVPFVNAGMNQFKGIFLGTQTPHYSQVANSQKCIRVGGKHNDLKIVGTDGYHHTFFEMLGNWSFGEYFKQDACKMAWELLTDVYRIPPNRLYITYFGGDERLGLPIDEETEHIWKSLGVDENRILPFGAKDNFWEMGLTGPCGPCSEIHFDHLGSTNRAEFVNKDLPDLTEIWNLVFINFNRLSDGSLIQLPKRHVDTGLGLERLCCALQKKRSSYDTDLFDYLLAAIQRNCTNVPRYSGKFGERDWDSLDTSYRTLADHMRMLTISLADGVIPEQNQKLRRIMRKSFMLAETVFNKKKGLIKELSNYVIDNLGEVYPELERNSSQIHQIIDYEEEIYSSNRQIAFKEWYKLVQTRKNLPNLDQMDIITTPSVVLAVKELTSSDITKIDADMAYRLYDTHGLDSEAITEVAEFLNIEFDPAIYESKMNEIRLKSRSNRQIDLDYLTTRFLEIDLDTTDDSYKYNYTKDGPKYNFPEIQTQVIQILDKDQFVSEINPNTLCSVILDKTNLYCEAGGQDSDRGIIEFENATFHVEYLSNVNDVIVHKGNLEGTPVRIGQIGQIKVDKERRLNNMRNHTCAHLLNAAVKKIKSATCQKSSKVTSMFVNLDVSVFGPKLNVEDAKQVEEIVGKCIKDGLDVRINVTDSQGLYSYDQITLIPGEVYPESDIRLVNVDGGSDLLSREPCCGTHVLNTADLEDFCIVSLKSLGRSTTSLYGVTGERARLARKNAAEFLEDLEVFTKSVKNSLEKPEILDMGVLSFKERLKFEVYDNAILPYVFKHEMSKKLDELSRRIKDRNMDELKNFIDMEMQDALERHIGVTKSNKKYIVHYLRSSMMFQSVPLQKATAMCSDMPVIVIAYSDNIVNARCCVPQGYQTKDFDAEKWLKEAVASVFSCKTTRQTSQNGVLVCNMKPKKVHLQEWHHKLAESLDQARNYINEKL